MFSVIRKFYGFLAILLFGGTLLGFGLLFTGVYPTPWPLLFYAIASCLTFFAYYSDKQAAKAKRWRASESGLHFMELVGGWPGALIASKLFRHKTAKWSYRMIFWAIVLMHLFIWYLWFFKLNCDFSRCNGQVLFYYAKQVMQDFFQQVGLGFGS